jgi:hypothetical protein
MRLYISLFVEFYFELTVYPAWIRILRDVLNPACPMKSILERVTDRVGR